MKHASCHPCIRHMQALRLALLTIYRTTSKNIVKTKRRKMDKIECKKQKEQWIIKQITNRGHAEADCDLNCDGCTQDSLPHIASAFKKTP